MGLDTDFIPLLDWLKEETPEYCSRFLYQLQIAAIAVVNWVLKVIPVISGFGLQWSVIGF